MIMMVIFTLRAVFNMDVALKPSKMTPFWGLKKPCPACNPQKWNG